jgi:hypothetical protein
MNVRTLKIEAEGDYWRKRVKPKIRLCGHWLARAGFKPGERVVIHCPAEGVMEIRANPVAFALQERK